MKGDLNVTTPIGLSQRRNDHISLFNRTFLRVVSQRNVKKKDPKEKEKEREGRKEG